MFDWWKKHAKPPQTPAASPETQDAHPAPQAAPVTRHVAENEATGHIGTDEPTNVHPVRLDDATAHLDYSHVHPVIPLSTSVPQKLPARIGHYRVLGALGTGGMAQVYLVEFDDGQAQMHRYALKTLLTHDPNDHEAHDRFVREIQICVKLRHPNVCTLVDWDIDADNTPYIVMELLEGELLHDHLVRLAPMPVAMAKPLIIQLLHGLEAIHKAGVVHRDLKPGNVFITRDGTLKIMDFGISRKVGLKSLTDSGMSLGTPEYISPEQVMDTHHVDVRSDLFNVGLIFYSMLTNRLPIHAGAVSDMLMQLVRGTLIPVSSYRRDLPPGVETWLNKLLAQNRDNRYNNAHEALEAITF